MKESGLGKFLLFHLNEQEYEAVCHPGSSPIISQGISLSRKYCPVSCICVSVNVAFALYLNPSPHIGGRPPPPEKRLYRCMTCNIPGPANIYNSIACEPSICMLTSSDGVIALPYSCTVLSCIFSPFR